jgi:glycosyltransferase involved in cell wall biosynthesis
MQACTPPDTYWALALLWRARGVRFVYDQHDLCPELLSARAPGAPHALAWFLRRLELGSYRRADLVITPNNAYRRLALGRGGCIPEQVVTVRSGPDEVVPREASGGSGPLVVAFAGVINEQDNVELLLRAGAAVLATRPGSLVLDLIGTGEDVPRLQRLADELGIADDVRWAGWLDGDALTARLHGASIGVSIDRDDAFSRLSTMAKVPEYLGLGLPALLADLPENRVTAGDAARYFAPGDLQSLRAALVSLLDDPAALRDLEESAARRGPALLWRHGADRLVGAYGWLLGGGAAVPGEQLVDAGTMVP